jgi:hypothetical protein
MHVCPGPHDPNVRIRLQELDLSGKSSGKGNIILILSRNEISGGSLDAKIQSIGEAKILPIRDEDDPPIRK